MDLQAEVTLKIAYLHREYMKSKARWEATESYKIYRLVDPYVYKVNKKREDEIDDISDTDAALEADMLNGKDLEIWKDYCHKSDIQFKLLRSVWKILEVAEFY